MKFSDIPQFTKSRYSCNVSWGYLESQLEQFKDHTTCLVNPLDLNPIYQRGHVWTVEKQIAYVEYILQGGPSSRLIYWNCSSWGTKYNTPLELVDGKQRLEAARAFLRGDIPAFGYKIGEFEGSLRLCGPDFVFCINDLKTQKEVMQWYLQLNSGGVVHEEYELERVRKLLRETK
jgi:hypothetical protein